MELPAPSATALEAAPAPAAPFVGGPRVAGARGHSLLELVAVLAVLSVLAAVTVPLLAPAHRRLAAGEAARQFAVVLRHAQALAQTGMCRVRVRLTGEGDGYVVSRADGGAWVTEESGSFAGAACATNYPGACVQFAAAGWPLDDASGVPRAGTFVFGEGSWRRSVVLQMGGRIRCR